MMKKILFIHEAFEEPSVESAWGKIVSNDTGVMFHNWCY